jgi:hypothetical protein
MTSAPLDRFVQGLGAMAMILGVLASLIECFLGYLVYRVILVVLGFAAGLAAGSELVGHFIAAPSGLDYFLVCGGLGLVAAMLSWFLYRLMFSLMILAAAGALVQFQGGRESWQLIPVGLAALVLAVLAFIHLRPIFIVMTAVAGGLGAVASGATLILGAEAAERLQHPDLRRDWLTLTVMLVVGAVLAGLGIFVQFKVTRMIQSRFAPPTGGKTPNLKRQTCPAGRQVKNKH